MAYVVQRRSGSWELRESRSTPAGPRSRTLASFRELTPDVTERAIARATLPVGPEEIVAAAARAGAPVAKRPAVAAAAALLTELDEGRPPPAALCRLLGEALADEAGAPTDSERAAGAWAGATLEQRGETLRDLLLLADRLPPPRRTCILRFPHIEFTSA